MKNDPNIQILLEKYLSKSRLSKYSQITESEDFDLKIRMYLLNIKYSEKFHSLLVQFEVIFRNSINEQLISDFGTNWFCNGDLEFTITQRNILSALILSLKQRSIKIDNCNITANLTFGFWVNLFNSDYDKTFWRQSLHKVFRNTQNVSRSTIRERLEKFRNLRNRISHCEPIVQFPLIKYYGQLIEVVEWIDEDLSKWLNQQIKLEQ